MALIENWWDEASSAYAKERSDDLISLMKMLVDSKTRNTDIESSGVCHFADHATKLQCFSADVDLDEDVPEIAVYVLMNPGFLVQMRYAKQPRTRETSCMLECVEGYQAASEWLSVQADDLRRGYIDDIHEPDLTVQTANVNEYPAVLSVPQYLALVEGVPLPTEQQKWNFVDYVSHAHSWYKHLPMFLPGVPFHFFMDMYAGYDRLFRTDGSRYFRKRKKTGLHYSEIPTVEYRRRFGCLAYSCNEESMLLAAGVNRGGLPRDGTAAVPGPDALMHKLPEEILEAGEARLTKVIHARTAVHGITDEGVGSHTQPVVWPEESGGPVVLERIFAHSRVMRERGYRGTPISDDDNVRKNQPELAKSIKQVDAVLYELLFPERKRQQKLMFDAISRVCDMISGQRAKSKVHRN